MTLLLIALVTGLSLASIYFIAGAGLTTVYGVLHVPNFAHGAFLMVGGYLTYAITRGIAVSVPVYLAVIIVASLGVGVLAALVDVLVLRRSYRGQAFAPVIATFGVLLLVEGIVEAVWGLEPMAQAFPTGTGSSLEIGGVTVPYYSIFTILVAVAVGVALWLVLSRTSIGMLIRAAAQDKEMAEALGVPVQLIYTGVFAVGGVLAGLAGGLAVPNYALSPEMGALFLLTAFAVVVVGGMGSIRGALLAAVVLGLGASVLTVYGPALSGIALFVPMILILLVRPQGLLKGW
ncbi:branched-chain amino acid ABC transporter permease [Georgenia ruanii]|nr:branched-chain amino acid ABC transporter permease [Georgenia ruanii]